MDGRKRGRVRRERERKTFNLLVHCLDACNDQMWIRQKLRDWNSVGVCDLSGRDPSYLFCIRDLGIWGIKQPWRFWSEFPIDTGALKDWCIGLLVKHFRTFRTCVIKIRAIYFPILLEVAESKIKLPVIFLVVVLKRLSLAPRLVDTFSLLPSRDHLPLWVWSVFTFLVSLRELINFC